MTDTHKKLAKEEWDNGFEREFLNEFCDILGPLTLGRLLAFIRSKSPSRTVTYGRTDLKLRLESLKSGESISISVRDWGHKTRPSILVGQLMGYGLFSTKKSSAGDSWKITRR